MLVLIEAAEKKKKELQGTVFNEATARRDALKELGKALKCFLQYDT